MNDIKIIGTNNFSTITKVCKEAKYKSKMISIIGYPGAGKTTALKHYYRNNSNVYYVRVKPSMKPKDFYAEILSQMGYPDNDTGVTLHSMLRKISYMLNDSIDKKLLIFDEAGKFTRRMLEYVHELRDDTMGNVGFVFAGPEYFHKNLIKWVNKELDGMPEIYRRINYWQNLSKPTKEEVKAMCNTYGINDETLHRNLFKLCSNFGEVYNRIMDLKYIETEETVE